MVQGLAVEMTGRIAVPRTAGERPASMGAEVAEVVKRMLQIEKHM